MREGGERGEGEVVGSRWSCRPNILSTVTQRDGRERERGREIGGEGGIEREEKVEREKEERDERGSRRQRKGGIGRIVPVKFGEI